MSTPLYARKRRTGVPEGASSNPARVNNFSVHVSSVTYRSFTQGPIIRQIKSIQGTFEVKLSYLFVILKDTFSITHTVANNSAI